MSPSASARPAEEWAEKVPWKNLSPRALEAKENIATLVADGYSHDEIADRVGIDRREVARAMAELKEEARALVDGAELPPLTDGEEEALRESLREFGQLVPVLVDEHGRTLDGVHRRRLLEELGAETDIRVVDTHGDDERARQVSLAVNAVRRTLSPTARRRAIEAELVHDPSRSDRALASLLGVSHHTVASVRAEAETQRGLLRLDRRVGRDGRAHPADRKPREKKQDGSTGSGRVLEPSLADLDPSDTVGGVGFLTSTGIRVRLPEPMWHQLGQPLQLEITVKPSA